MASLSQAKTLGGVGSVLIFIPFLSLIGYILLIVAVRDISNDLQDRSIFRNIVISAVTGIVGALAGAVVVVLVALGSGATPGLSTIVGVGGGLVVAWIFLVISAVFLRRAYDTIGQRLGVGTFKMAATLYLIGASLTIVFVGLLVLFVAEIVQAVAFFSIPDHPPAQPAAGFAGQASQAAPQASPPMAPASVGSKFCTSCGTRISTSATFCYNCGARQAVARPLG